MTCRVPLILAAAGAMALGACAPNPYAQPTTMSRTQQGAIAGAARQVPDRLQRAMVRRTGWVGWSR